jgi:RNA polymerase sigma-70 factor (ECF subfamily)
MASAAIINSATIEELSPGLFAFAYRAVRQREEAEDLVQDTWISALKTVPSFEGRSSLRTWLVSILRRRIADRFRRERPSEQLEEEKVAWDQAAPEDRLDAYEAADIAARAMTELSELERTAVTLCDVQDLDRDEASTRMGVTRGHLRVLLHRGRHKLEAALKANGVEGPLNAGRVEGRATGREPQLETRAATREYIGPREQKVGARVAPREHHAAAAS